jgi:hypothetical protein
MIATLRVRHRLVVAGCSALVAVAVAVVSGELLAFARGEGVSTGSSLVSSANAFVMEAQVAAGADGRAVTVWNQTADGGGSTLLVSTSANAGTHWSAAQRLDGLVGAGTTFNPEVAMAPSGAAVVAWQRPPPVEGQMIEAVARTSATGSWSAPTVIAHGWMDNSRQLGIDATGDAVLVYAAGSGPSQRIDAVSLNGATGIWSGPLVLGRSSSELPNPTVAVNAAGDAVAAWSTSRRPVSLIAPGDEGSGRVDSWAEASVMRAGAWSAPQRLGQETQFVYDLNTDATPDGPQNAIDTLGQAIVVWQHNKTGPRLVADATALGPGARRWRSLPPLRATRVQAPQVATSAGGWVTIAWENGRSGIATTTGPISGCCWSAPTTFRGTGAHFDFDLNLVAGPGHAAALAYAQAGKAHPARGPSGHGFTVGRAGVARLQIWPRTQRPDTAIARRHHHRPAAHCLDPRFPIIDPELARRAPRRDHRNRALMSQSSLSQRGHLAGRPASGEAVVAAA